jgi:REP-associated tyrosine transposase
VIPACVSASFQLAGITDPGYNDCVHRHLRRLHRIWIDHPIYFVTTCTFRRRKILTDANIAPILVNELSTARDRHRWAIGRYVIMPDHIHFFCAAELEAKPLMRFMQAWKQWAGKRIVAEMRIRGSVWQPEFFDHVLRSSESYSQKWDYVRDNPVRAGLVDEADKWPWQGEIEDLML